MNCEKCHGSGWVTIDPPDGGYSYVEQCSCRAEKIAERKRNRKPATREAAEQAADMLKETLQFFPATLVYRGMIADALYEMCSTMDELTWLVRQAPRFHTKWDTCGLPGLRQILCSRYTPKDGIVLSSTEAYPEGIPQSANDKPQFPPLLGERERPLNSGAERMIVAAAKMLPKFPKTPNFKPVTQADVEEELREAAANTKPMTFEFLRSLSDNDLYHLSKAVETLRRERQIQANRITELDYQLVKPESVRMFDRCSHCDGVGLRADETFCDCSLGREMDRIAKRRARRLEERTRAGRG